MEGFYKLGEFKNFLIALIDNKIVDAIIVPMKGLTDNTYSPFLIKDSKILKECESISPVMSINSAKVVSKLTLKGALSFKTAVVLKPCELTAFRELIKLNQINPENIITISFDCYGINSLKNIEISREICEICKDFTPDYADIKIYSFGMKESILFSKIDLKKLKLENIDFDNDKREKFIRNRLNIHIKKREETLSHIRKDFSSLLTNCIVCKNCVRVCPICFCRECFFDSPALKGNSITYSMRASRMEGLVFPENKLLFHLGRMNHMGISCVSCGACEDACPAEIPISEMFAAVGDELKKLFSYEPGKNLEEKIPFTCYEHDELHSFEKPYVEKI